LRPALLGVGAVIALVGLGLVGARLAVDTDQGRGLLESGLDGMKVGRFGTLDVEGVAGDPLRSVRVDRLTLSDEAGVWLVVEDAALDWSWRNLFQRTFDASRIAFGRAHVLRIPVLGEAGPEQPLPLTIRIGALEGRIVTEPAVTRVAGDWRVGGRLAAERDGRLDIDLGLQSLLHAGDRISARGRWTPETGGAVTLEGNESTGQALRGLLGLSLDQPLTVDASMDGTPAQGRAVLSVRSGASEVATGDGVWSEAGGRLEGRLDPRLSDRLLGLREILGERVDVGADWTPPREGRTILAVRMVSAGLRVDANGPVSLEARRTLAPLETSIRAPALDAIVPGDDVAIGAGSFDGTLVGGFEDWVLDGTLALTRVGLPDLRLDGLSGPAKVSRDAQGALRFEGDLDALGVRGSGLAGRWLGPRPELAFAGGRATDGTVLLDSLSVRGAEARLDGRGRREAGGALGFDGTLTLDSLTSVSARTRGGFDARFWLDQAGSDRPWTFRIDGRGQRFATGLAEADRLLGPAPTLQASGQWVGGSLRIADARLDGRALRVRSAGAVIGARTLAVPLSWSADGPIPLGPVEIAGTLAGQGRLDGALASPTLTLGGDIGRLDLPQLTLSPARFDLTTRLGQDPFDAEVRLAGVSPQGTVTARADVRLAGNTIALRDIAVSGAGIDIAGAASVRGNAPASADLRVSIGPGALLAAGTVSGTARITETPGGAVAQIALSGTNVTPRAGGLVFEALAVRGAGNLERMPFTTTLRLRDPMAASFEGNGVLEAGGALTRVTLSGAGTANAARFSTRSPLLLELADGATTVTGDLDVGAGQRAGQLAFTATNAARRFTARARFADLPLRLAAEELTGSVSGEAALDGSGGPLAGTLTARLDDVRARGTARDLAVDTLIEGRLARDTLTVNARTQEAAGLAGFVDLALPVQSSTNPLRLAVATAGPLRGTFDLRGEIRAVADLVFAGQRSLAGQVVTEGRVGGTLARPRVDGSFALTGGSFADPASGLELGALEAAGSLGGDQVVLQRLSATDRRRGRVSGDGRLGLAEGAASTLDLQLENFQVIDTGDVTARASGTLGVSRAAGGNLAVRGALTIQEARISPEIGGGAPGIVELEVQEINLPPDLAASRAMAARERDAAGSGGLVADLDVSLRAPRGVFVRGRGLNAELSVDARVGGTTARPTLSGVARIFRGEYEFAGRVFTFDDRGTITLSTDPDQIRLSLEAVRDEDPTFVARVRITGTAADPRVALSSTPSLPQDEILSRVLFGRSATSLSGSESAQLATALASVAGGNAFDVIGGLRDLARLDRLVITGGDTGFAFAGGRYLTDRVYLELIGGGQGELATQVEYRPNRNLALVSRVTNTGETRVAVRWRRSSPAPGTPAPR